MFYLSAIFLGGLIFSGLAWKKPLTAIYLIVGLLPAYLIRFRILDIPLTFLELLILLLFLICLIKKRLDWKIIFHQPYFWPIIAILFFASLAVFVSPKTIQALGIWKAYFIEPILFFWVLISLIRTRKQVRMILAALGFSVIYLSLFCCWQKFSGYAVPQSFLNSTSGVDRVVGPFGYPNALGLYLGPIIILYTGWLVSGSKKLLPLMMKLSVIIFGFITIILAQSEAAIGAVVAIWFLMGVLYKKTRYPVIGLAVIGVLILLLASGLREFIITKIFLLDYSGTVRRIIWHESWKMIKYRWLLGAGLAGYQHYIYPYHLNTFEIFPYPHNIALNFWSELGLGGLLAFIWLGVKYFWTNLKIILKNPGAKIMSFALIGVGLEIILHGLVDVPYFKNDLSALFWLFIALSYLNLKIGLID